MSLIALIVLLVIIGVILYYVNTAQKIDPKIKNIINVAVVIAVIILLLKVFGVWSEITSMKVN